MKAAALAALLCCATAAAQSDDGEAFRRAQGDIDALERLGDAHSRWSDDAWVEAARLAERANDYARARRDLERAIAIADDPRLAERARGDLARLTALADWSTVSAEHERLLPAVNNIGDPRPALVKLEELARTNPRYPRAAMLMLQIAAGWEREGEDDRAVEWLAQARAAAATPTDRLRTAAETIRTLIRIDRLADAERELAHLDAPESLRANLRERLADAKLRRAIRWSMWGVLVVLAAVAAWRLRGRYRKLVRPPIEVLFMLPIGAVLAIVSATGNPLVARAIRWIVIAGIAIAWIAGSIEGKRRWLVVVLAVIAAAAATYIAVDHGPLVELLRETWREL